MSNLLSSLSNLTSLETLTIASGLSDLMEELNC